MRGDLGILATVRSFHACTKISRHFFRIFTKYAWKYHYKKVPNETNLCQETNIATKFAFLETSAIFTRKLSKNCLSFLMGAMGDNVRMTICLKNPISEDTRPGFLPNVGEMNCPCSNHPCDELSQNNPFLWWIVPQTNHPCDELFPNTPSLWWTVPQTSHPCDGLFPNTPSLWWTVPQTNHPCDGLLF